MLTPAQPIIRIQELKRAFRVGNEMVQALKGVSFDVFPGEFLTIMGKSGSGKSTLLNLLGCLDRPNSGTYELDGQKVNEMGPNLRADFRNRKIGFVFQSYQLLARTSALENVMLPLLYNRAIPSSRRREMAEKALVAVDLADRMNHTPNQLSGGQQQRVAIARALVNDPILILADEATGNLDTKTAYDIMALFQSLNERGSSIVFVTHETDIAWFSKRTITLQDGLISSDMLNPDVKSAQKARERLLAEIQEVTV